jgi:tRNA A-37 threonylcarbamoyl transferase component Bud32/membrane-associated phospholipid phosphatase
VDVSGGRPAGAVSAWGEAGAPERPRSSRRRPSGQPPPLPHHVQATGVGWLTAAVLLVSLTVGFFVGGLRGPAIAITDADDAVVGWLAGVNAPGLLPTMRAVAALSSWTAVNVLLWGLLLTLLILRRLGHLLVVLAAWIVQGLLIQYVVAPLVQRSRPFGVEFRTEWTAWALPSEQVAALVVTLMGLVYGLVPEGRWRQRGKWIATGLVAVVGLARVYLGVEAPTDVLVAVAVGVAVSLLGFRLFTPNEVFPVTYRRGRGAHLDVEGVRGIAIRRALDDQLGVLVEEVTPFGLTGSAGSTPLRITLKGDPPRWLFGKLYARSHLRADRWYKLGRELLYGRLEDERPFHSVRRLVQQEDYALSLMQRAGLPSPAPYGFVELTPEREYLLITEFFDGATELGESLVNDDIIDEGLLIVRRLWDAGLAHRDIKPANLLVRHGRLLLIDVAFVEIRPTPWRQAVDLANMMLCLALRSSPQQVNQRARRHFTDDEISEGFAAAHGLALPSQLRHLIRTEGRDLHAEFLALLPARPPQIGIQRWSLRRIGLLVLTAVVLVVLGKLSSFVLVNNDVTTTTLEIGDMGCDRPEPLWLEAQSVPSASAVPCLNPLPAGWTFASANVRNGWSQFTLDHDRIGPAALVVRLDRTCDVSGAVQQPSDRPATQRYERSRSGSSVGAATWYTVIPGGCFTARFDPTGHAAIAVVDEADSVVDFVTRAQLDRILTARSNGRLHLDP